MTTPLMPPPAQTFGPPEPPQGPGVQPPFPAPPVEGKGFRIGLGLGIGAAVAVLVCGGGIAAAIGLGATMTKALGEQATKVTGDYFTALKTGKYDEAYAMQCPERQQAQSQEDYVAERTADPILDYQVGNLDLTTVDLAVPVKITYVDGDQGTVYAHLAQSTATGAFQVCGVEE